jgi:hypothetical protein
MGERGAGYVDVHEVLWEALQSASNLLNENGGRGRDRTCDQSIKSRMLYQLSYASCLLLRPLWGRGDRPNRPDVSRPLTRNHLEKDSTGEREKLALSGGIRRLIQPTNATSALMGIIPRSNPISSSLRMASRPSSP